MRRRHCECVAWIANLPLPVRFFPSPPSHDPSLSGSHTHTPSTMLRIRNHARRVVSVSPSRSLSTSSSPSSSSPASPLPSFTPRVSLSSEVRSGFLGYFNTAGHTILPSSSLVPQGDETLLFTNAGMVQLKDMLVGLQPPPAGSNGRLASAQKCIRAGGKHNDLENVGHVRHNKTATPARAHNICLKCCETHVCPSFFSCLCAPPCRLLVTIPSSRCWVTSLSVPISRKRPCSSHGTISPRSWACRRHD